MFKNIEISGNYNWEKEIKSITHKINTYHYMPLFEVFQDLFNKAQKYKETDINYLDVDGCCIYEKNKFFYFIK